MPQVIDNIYWNAMEMRCCSRKIFHSWDTSASKEGKDRRRLRLLYHNRTDREIRMRS